MTHDSSRLESPAPVPAIGPAEFEFGQYTLDSVTEFFTRELKVKVIERKFLLNFLFSEKDLVVVVGQDGLVANTAKYVNGLPILAINPDVNRFDGVLLPYTINDFEIGDTSFPFEHLKQVDSSL